MAASNYAESLKRVLQHEGGYTNDAADPGGPTNYGITIYDARMYWKPDATAADVKAMPLSVAKDIYKSKYWDKMFCDQLPSGVDYCTFDYGVNSGVGRALKVKTSFAGRSPEATIIAMCDERLNFLRQLKTWPVFGNGWSKRVSDVRAFSLQLAKTASIPLPPDIPTPEPQPVNIWVALFKFILSLFRR
jgi:lysozyme family protein